MPSNVGGKDIFTHEKLPKVGQRATIIKWILNGMILKANLAFVIAGLISPMRHGHFSTRIELCSPITVNHTANIATNLMGKIEQRLFVVVYTPRHELTRIISARKADQREIKHYENSTRND